MSDCGRTQSYMSKALDMELMAGNSQEFCRGAKAYTPKSASWAGDLLITSEADYRQSRMKWVRGGACRMQTKVTPNEECGELTLRPSGAIDPEETGARDCDLAITFDPEPPSDPDAQFGNGWEMKILASTDECGAMTDGGDVYHDMEASTKIQSLDGSFTFEYVAPMDLLNVAFLDNRNTYSDDTDKGLLIAVQHPLTKNWTFKFSTGDERDAGRVSDMTDITAFVSVKLGALSMTIKDVFLVGMI